MIYTTSNKIRSFSPCAEQWKVLLQTVGKTKADDDSISMQFVLDTLGLYTATWTLRAFENSETLCRKFSAWCATAAEQFVQDPRLIASVQAANKLLSESELETIQAEAINALKDMAPVKSTELEIAAAHCARMASAPNPLESVMDCLEAAMALPNWDEKAAEVAFKNIFCN